jgi:C1A family cysteine protease
MNTPTHHFGWKPSLPDFHDIPADARDLTVLDEVDPRPDMPPVYDQGQLGSCTANAIAAALQYDRILNSEEAPVPSRLFLYYEERVREGTVDTDSGAYGRDGFKVLKKTGCPPESVWPYIVEGFATKPNEMAFEEAHKYRIGNYVHPGLGHGITLLDRVESFKRLLSNKQTIAFGFTVYESFEGSGWEDGLMPMPEKGESVLGGHEVLLVGYLAEQPEYALVRNSWGSGWQREGYFLMPWKFLCDPAYASDWRSIYREAGK